MTPKRYFSALLFLTLCVAPLYIWAASPKNTQLTAESFIPTVFVYRCDNADPAVQDCDPIPVYGGPFQMHITHTWFQLVNTSNHTFGLGTAAENLQLYLYGKNGQKVVMDDQCAMDHHYNQDDGYIDLLAHAGGTLIPGQAVFLYLDYCMNDNSSTTGTIPSDANPPFYAKVIASANSSAGEPDAISLVFNVGAEESVERLDGKFSSSAASLLDKEIMALSNSNHKASR